MADFVLEQDKATSGLTEHACLNPLGREKEASQKQGQQGTDNPFQLVLVLLLPIPVHMLTITAYIY